MPISKVLDATILFLEQTLMKEKHSMKKHILILDFHGIVKIRINSRYRFYIEYYRKEFHEKFITNDEKNIDIEIYLDLDFPKIMDGDIYIKKRFKKIYPYSCVIRGVEDKKTSIFFKTPIITKLLPSTISLPFFDGQFFNPLLYMKSILKNFLMPHASSVFDNDGGYVFISSVGGGKTTVAFNLASKGYGFLGDDYAFLSDDGILYSYPNRIHYFSYRKNKNYFINISRKTLFLADLKSVLRTVLKLLTGQYFFFSTRIDIRDLLPTVKVGDSVKVKNLFLLKPQSEDIHLDGSNSVLFDYILGCIEMRDPLFNNILKDNKDFVKNIKERERDFLSKLSQNFGFNETSLDEILVNGV